MPRLVIARDGGRVVGAVPLYLKTNSYGEFIFDWGWANAAHGAGVRYYPKLVAAIPFTPVTGQRLPVHPDADPAAVTADAAARGPAGRRRRARLVGALPVLHGRREGPARRGTSYLPRLSMQFHWHNRAERPFESFDDYLTTFRSRNRKQVRKERQTAAAHGLTLSHRGGQRARRPGDWRALHAFYLTNVARHGGIPYLSERFFEVARATLAHRLVATLAYQGAEPVAGTVNFEKGTHLYGRYWGCLEDYQMLHFELCYYRLIERAIERRYTLFEAGAQGEHKLKRGLAPAFTHSAHWIRHPALADAIASFIEREAVAVAEEARFYDEHSPFNAQSSSADGDDDKNDKDT